MKTHDAARRAGLHRALDAVLDRKGAKDTVSPKWEIVDTVTGDVVATYPTEQAARRDQKLFNAGPSNNSAGAGYVVRYAVKRIKEPAHDAQGSGARLTQINK